MLVLYDGMCGFCDASVQWILRHDPAGRFRFAPLQGETAADVRRRHPDVPENIETLVFVEGSGAGERVWLRSHAVFRIAGLLGWPWRIAGVFVVFPRFLTDLAYRAFARIRYYVWGRRDACRIPKPEERARFLP
jgi:predicted DCC family thiol-disulfide oxidoreductase YuxK